MRRLVLFAYVLLILVLVYNRAHTFENVGGVGSTIPQANGGWGTVNELGTIANTGTATCNFSGTLLCHFTAASAAAFTMANPTNLCTNCEVFIAWTQAAGSFTNITWGSHFFSFDVSTETVTALNGQGNLAQDFYFTAAAGTQVVSKWWSDGTNLYADQGPQMPRADNYFAFTGFSGPLINGEATAYAGSSATIAAAGTDFIANGENASQAVIATELSGQYVVYRAGTAKSLECWHTTVAQAGGVVYTLDKNTVGTAVTVTATNADGLCTDGVRFCLQDTTHTVTVAVGDLLSIKVVNSNAANATGVTGCTFVING